MKRDEQHRKGEEKRGEQNGRTRKGGLGTGKAEQWLKEKKGKSKEKEKKDTTYGV